MNSDQQLIGVMSDFFLPALIANSLQLQFLLQRFLLQPEILKKCQEEIKNVVGHSRLPTLADRRSLPYVEATIRESLRHDVLIPSGFPHTATADTNFQGYDIPKVKKNHTSKIQFDVITSISVFHSAGRYCLLIIVWITYG